MITFTIENGGLNWPADNGLSHGYCGCREVKDGKLEAKVYSLGHIPFVTLAPDGVWVEHTIDSGSGPVVQTSYQMFQKTALEAGFGI